jgi:hypothetical protein
MKMASADLDAAAAAIKWWVSHLGDDRVGKHFLVFITYKQDNDGDGGDSHLGNLTHSPTTQTLE